MSVRPPKPRSDKPQMPSMPPALAADYDDELTPAQVAALQTYAPQNESEMGELVHEFTW